MSEKEIMKADLNTKKRFVLVLCCLCILGVIFLIMVNYFSVRAHIGSSAAKVEYFIYVFKMLVIFLFSGFLFFVGALIKKSVLIIRYKQYPIPGEKLLRDTVVVKDRAAINRARLFIGLAVIIFFFSIVFTWICWNFTRMIPSVL
ncbi:MAG: hypothetical protein D6B27_00125 [Gammaproteobacteria bacterium]|nr:MAG: hypothetical protein D6B27_00125 [Gammaproteobacteria bacterium]